MEGVWKGEITQGEGEVGMGRLEEVSGDLCVCVCALVGSNTTNPFWIFVRDILHKPSEEQINCHAPKPILLDTGEMDWPYPWQPFHPGTPAVEGRATGHHRSAGRVHVRRERGGEMHISIWTAQVMCVHCSFGSRTMSGRKTREAVKNVSYHTNVPHLYQSAIHYCLPPSLPPSLPPHFPLLRCR